MATRFVSHPASHIPGRILKTLILVFVGLVGVPSPWAAGNAGELQGELRINSEPASRAVVYLTQVDGRPISAPPVEKTIRQENIRFIPDFLIVPPGSTIRFENHDDEIHNIHSDLPENRFDTGAHLPGTVKTVTLKHPGAVPLRCRTHPPMRGLIFVAPSPYVAVTDNKGKFVIRDVPPGTYRIEAWHSRLTPEERSRGARVSVVGAGPNTVQLSFDAKAGAGVDLTDTPDRDWSSVVDQIRAELDRAIAIWKKGNRTAATMTVMSAQSKLYGESGLREKITQTIGADHAEDLERRFDAIRKQVQGIGGTEAVTEAGLREDAGALIDRLTADAGKLKTR